MPPGLEGCRVRGVSVNRCARACVEASRCPFGRRLLRCCFSSKRDSRPRRGREKWDGDGVSPGVESCVPGAAGARMVANSACVSWTICHTRAANAGRSSSKKLVRRPNRAQASSGKGERASSRWAPFRLRTGQACCVLICGELGLRRADTCSIRLGWARGEALKFGYPHLSPIRLANEL